MGSPGVVIRPGRAEDRDALCALEQAAHDYPWTPRQLRDSVVLGHTWLVAEQDGTLVGHAVWQWLVPDAELLNMAVRSGARRQGVARALLRAGLRQAREVGAAQCFLEVRESNRPAIRLYQTQGFETVGRRPGYYPTATGRETALVMMHTLSTQE